MTNTTTPKATRLHYLKSTWHAVCGVKTDHYTRDLPAVSCPKCRKALRVGVLIQDREAGTFVIKYPEGQAHG